MTTSSSSRSRSRPVTCPDENLLVQLADGQISETRRASVDRHLDGCVPCTCLVAELAGMARPLLPVPTRYTVIRQLGAGAMGVVWEAEDTHLARRVALKFVRATDDAADYAHRSRLFREARTLAQLRHPNVVTVFDVGSAGRELFLTLELVIGADARTWRAARPRSTADIVDVWRQAAAGLAAVHRAGILHRDVKPDNVLVADDGRVLLTDFGLASDPQATNHTNTTAAGTIVGTPLYMAHEQLLGEPASQQTDQYALCVSMWEAIAGERPFSGPTLGAIAMAMQQPPAIPRAVSRTDARLLAVIARGLDANPANRFPSIDVLLDDLALAANDIDTPAAPRLHTRHKAAPRRQPGSETRRSMWLAIGAAVLAAASTLVILAWRDRAPDAHGINASLTSMSEAESNIAPTPTERVPSPLSPSPTSQSLSSAPAPKGTVTQSEWRHTLDRATDKLGFGDGRGCLSLLASMPSAPRVMEEQATTLRAMCTMKTGDCTAGRKLLEAVAQANHWDATRRDEALRIADFTYCPLDAAPRTIWPERAKYRLQVASGAKTSCKPVLAFIAKHRIAFADERDRHLLETTCHLNDNDCSGARASWRHAFTMDETDPVRSVERTRLADDAFAKTFTQCP